MCGHTFRDASEDLGPYSEQLIHQARDMSGRMGKSSQKPLVINLSLTHKINRQRIKQTQQEAHWVDRLASSGRYPLAEQYVSEIVLL